MSRDDLRAKIKKTDALPTISSVAQHLLSLPLETVRGEKELLNLIESDPFIAARVIGMANSPLFGASKKVCTVSDAAMLLGLSRVKTIAIAIALMGPIRVRESKIFSLRDLWLHSFSMAIGMRSLSNMLPRAKRPAEDMLFLSGLLHDLGYLALAYLAPDKFDAFLGSLESHPEVSPISVEMEEFGMNHAELGEILGRSWDLPEEVISVIAGHHDVEPDASNVPLILARLIESITGEGAIRKPPSPMAEAMLGELESIGLSQENLEDARETLELQQEQIALLADMLAG